MFERILVGTDFSAPSAAVLSCVPQLAAVGVREVILGHVVYVANTPGLEVLLTDEARPLLARQAEALTDAGLKVTTDIRVGVPAVTLAEMAEDHDVAATVMGSHGRSLLRRIMLGSVTGALLQVTSRPVLIVTVRICETPEGTTCELACKDLFAKVLFPTDFSNASEHAFRHLTGIVAQTGSPCTLLHVQDEVRLRHQIERLAEFNSIDESRLGRLQTELIQAGASAADVAIGLGAPTRKIVQEAAEHGHSLIVMGTQGRGALAEVMVGSVAMNVARLTPVPVLFVPMPG